MTGALMESRLVVAKDHRILEFGVGEPEVEDSMDTTKKFLYRNVVKVTFEDLKEIKPIVNVEKVVVTKENKENIQFLLDMEANQVTGISSHPGSWGLIPHQLCSRRGCRGKKICGSGPG